MTVLTQSLLNEKNSEIDELTAEVEHLSAEIERLRAAKTQHLHATSLSTEVLCHCFVVLCAAWFQLRARFLLFSFCAH